MIEIRSGSLMKAVFQIGLVVVFLVASAEAIYADAPTQFRVTNAEYETIMRPEPDSFRVVEHIPQNTEVEIIDRQQIQQGKFKVNWYQVEYNGKTGWVSGRNFEDSEEESSFSMKYSSPGGPDRKSLMGLSY